MAADGSGASSDFHMLESESCYGLTPHRGGGGAVGSESKVLALRHGFVHVRCGDEAGAAERRARSEEPRDLQALAFMRYVETFHFRQASGEHEAAHSKHALCSQGATRARTALINFVAVAKADDESASATTADTSAEPDREESCRRCWRSVTPDRWEEGNLESALRQPGPALTPRQRPRQSLRADAPAFQPRPQTQAPARGSGVEAGARRQGGYSKPPPPPPMAAPALLHEAATLSTAPASAAPPPPPLLPPSMDAPVAFRSRDPPPAPAREAQAYAMPQRSRQPPLSWPPGNLGGPWCQGDSNRSPKPLVTMDDLFDLAAVPPLAARSPMSPMSPLSPSAQAPFGAREAPVRRGPGQPVSAPVLRGPLQAPRRSEEWLSRSR